MQSTPIIQCKKRNSKGAETRTSSLMGHTTNTTISAPLSQQSSSMAQLLTPLDDQPSTSKIDHSIASKNQLTPEVIAAQTAVTLQQVTPIASKLLSSVEEQPTAIVDQPLLSEVSHLTISKGLSSITSTVPTPAVDHNKVLLVPQLYSFIEKELTEVGADLSNQQTNLTSEINQQRHVDPHPPLVMDHILDDKQVDLINIDSKSKSQEITLEEKLISSNQLLNTNGSQSTTSSAKHSTVMETDHSSDNYQSTEEPINQQPSNQISVDQAQKAQLHLNQFSHEKKVDDPSALDVKSSDSLDSQPSTSKFDKISVQISNTTKIKSTMPRRINKPRESKLRADILLKLYISDDSDDDEQWS